MRCSRPRPLHPAAPRHGTRPRAARLYGAAEALHEAIGHRPDPATRALVARQLGAARARTDAATWAAAWAAGRALPAERAVAEALAAPEGDAGGPAPPAGPGRLTPREVEVLRLLAAGRSNREMAAALSVSPRTVERHLENLYRKIAARNRAEAAAWALRHRLAG